MLSRWRVLPRHILICGRSRKIQQSKSELYPSGGAFCPSQRRIRRSIHRKVKQKRIGSWRHGKSPSCSSLLSQHRRSRCTAWSQSRLRPANTSGQPPDAKIMDPFRPHDSPISNLLELFCQRTDRDAEANDAENQGDCRVKDANAASGH